MSIFFAVQESIKLSKLLKTPFLKTQEIMTTERRSFLENQYKSLILQAHFFSSGFFIGFAQGIGIFKIRRPDL